MRKRWERFWHSRLALRKDSKMRRGRHSLILGREEKPLLDELQVSPIKEREQVKEESLLGFQSTLGFEG
jgi:hypothetical protein